MCAFLKSFSLLKPRTFSKNCEHFGKISRCLEKLCAPKNLALLWKLLAFLKNIVFLSGLIKYTADYYTSKMCALWPIHKKVALHTTTIQHLLTVWPGKFQSSLWSRWCFFWGTWQADRLIRGTTPVWSDCSPAKSSRFSQNYRAQITLNFGSI